VQKKTSNATKQMAAMSCLQHLDLVLWVVEPKHALKSRESVVAESQKWPWTGVPESTPGGSGVFLSGPKPESKFFEKRDPDPESVFNFGNGSSLHGHFLNKKIDFGWIHSSQSLNRSRILKFKNFWTRIQKLWNRSGVGVSKSDSGHLCRRWCPTAVFNMIRVPDRIQQILQFKTRSSSK